MWVKIPKIFSKKNNEVTLSPQGVRWTQAITLQLNNKLLTDLVAYFSQY